MEAGVKLARWPVGWPPGQLPGSQVAGGRAASWREGWAARRPGGWALGQAAGQAASWAAGQSAAWLASRPAQPGRAHRIFYHIPYVRENTV